MANSDYNNLRAWRDRFNLLVAICCVFLYIPHLFCYLLIILKIINRRNPDALLEDIKVNARTLNIKISTIGEFLYFIHNSSYFRSLFYYRIGPILSLLIGWYRPGDKYFILSKSMTLGGGFLLVHPFSTIINAESIGINFQCKNCTPIASKRNMNDRPIIGNNVVLGASVTIIGGIHIGDNVTIGAGSVVVKDVPSNCIVAGNPARIIRTTA